jgi:hypothetical protein
MDRIALTKNLFLDEYIPESLYREYEGKETELIKLIDPRIIKADQQLRTIFGPVTINNWWVGGIRNWSGLRTPESPYYSPTSMHSVGKASDKLFKDYDSEEVQEWIKEHWKEIGITRMEIGVSWVHTDVKDTSGSSLVTFKS